MLPLRNAGLAITTTTDGYCLATPTDLAKFERVLAAGGEAVPVDAEHASSLFGAALSRWRSRPYPELDHVEEAVIEARRLEDLVEGAREKRYWPAE
jgi:hypothetical protein